MNKPIRILHLEDKRSDADIVQRELKKADIKFELLWVTNKKDFQKALKEFSPNIILSDHSLPSFTSIQALKIAREAGSDIPFILITATMADEAAVNLMKEGISDYILKDRLVRLPRAIVSSLEKHNSEKDKQKYFEEVTRNEKLFRALIEHNKESITLLDEHFKPFYLGSSKEHITGYTIEERKIMSGMEITHPEDVGLLKKVMQDVLDNPGEPIPITYRMKHKKGHYIYVDGTATNLLNNDNVKGIVTNLRDITKTKKAEEQIIESETKYRSLVEQASDAIIVSKTDGSIVDVNTSAEKLFGYKKTQLNTMELKDLLFEHDLPPQMDKIMNNSKVIYERRIKKNDNTPVDVEVSAGMIQDGRVLGIFRDITEKKIREIQEEFDRNNLNALINNTKDLMWSVDKDFNLITSNQPFDEMSKINFGKVITKGSSVLDVAYNAEMRSHFKQFYERAFSGEAFTTIEHFEIPVESWTEISYYPIRRGEVIIGTACHSRDITHIKIAEQKLINSEEQLRSFSRHLNKIQEEERAHLARELHDELSQELAGLKMGISLITMLDSKDKMVKKANDMLKDVDNTIQAMRKIATELRPGILDSLGLMSSLEWLGNEFKERKKIKCIVNANVTESKFEKNISNCFFRVCQESLTNIFKHAQASEVKIQVDQTENDLIMKISDNGKGIAGEKLANPFSMGLLGMHERAKTIGADLTITSEANSGTTIQLKVTLKK